MKYILLLISFWFVQFSFSQSTINQDYGAYTADKVNKKKHKNKLNPYKFTSVSLTTSSVIDSCFEVFKREGFGMRYRSRKGNAKNTTLVLYRPLPMSDGITLYINVNAMKAENNLTKLNIVMPHVPRSKGDYLSEVKKLVAKLEGKLDNLQVGNYEQEKIKEM